MLGHQQRNAAPPEAGAAGWRPAAALESELPQTRIVQAEFSLALERYGSESAVLVLAGELDLFSAPAIKDALAKVPHLTVDLRLVTFIDATTLGLLLGASRRQQAHGGQLLILVGPQTPMTAFEATGLDRLLAIRRLGRRTKKHRSMQGKQLDQRSIQAGEQLRSIEKTLQSGVDEFLDVAVERPALDQLEVEVGRTLEDRVLP